MAGMGFHISSSKTGQETEDLCKKNRKPRGWTHHNPKKQNEAVQVIAVLNRIKAEITDWHWF